VYDQFSSRGPKIYQEDLKKPLNGIDELSFEESSRDGEAGGASCRGWEDYQLMKEMLQN
jgi:hypothetical protein